MKKHDEKRLNVFRNFFQTVPILLEFGIVIAFKRYNLYFPDINLDFGDIGSFIIAILICFATQLFVNTNPMLGNTKSGIVAGTILTIEIMLFILFAQYHLLFSFVIVAAIVLFSSWLTKKIISVNKEKKNDDKKIKTLVQESF